MTDDEQELEPIYRMPATLGPAPGPRNMPKSKAHLRFDGDTTVLAVTALADEQALKKILPPRCRLLGEPLLEANFFVQTHLGWLAGRGYNFLVLRIPVECETDQESVHANFCPVLWENMADPIVTGRDELGSPKLFAELPNPTRVGAAWTASAHWEGFRFFDMEVTQLKIADTSLPPALPNLLYRYHARTGEWRKPDVAQLTRAHRGAAPAPTIHEYCVGKGHFRFHPARWEDMPTQYTYINTLANLPLLEFRGARRVRMSGISDLAAQEIVVGDVL